jgi:hypothetical protein
MGKSEKEEEEENGNQTGVDNLTMFLILQRGEGFCDKKKQEEEALVFSILEFLYFS